MNKIITKKEVIEVVCIVLEKEKTSSSIVATSLRDLLRKTKREDFDIKEIKMALEYLESQNKIETVSKSNRQTVLRVKDNLFELDLSQLDFIKENEESKDIKLGITPRKLLELLKSQSDSEKAEMSCKEIRKVFDCSFSQVMSTLKLLEKSKKIEYSFERGIIYVSFILDKNIEDNLKVKELTAKDEEIFDFIGESLESIFKEIDNLKRENAELNKKLAIAEVQNKRLREDVTLYSSRCDSLKGINDRLRNQIINRSNN